MDMVSDPGPESGEAPGAKMPAVRGDARAVYDRTLRSPAGLLLLWPAFIVQLFHPGLGSRRRGSSSIDVVLEWPGR